MAKMFYDNDANLDVRRDGHMAVLIRQPGSCPGTKPAGIGCQCYCGAA